MSSSSSASYKLISRRISKVISIGDVLIGGLNPVVVQTMTNTKTSDSKSTIEQIVRCYKLGAELIRVSVPDKESTYALNEIVRESPIPIIADVHFHYKRGVEAILAGAKCIRINPGNIGTKERASEIVKIAKDNNCTIRIGVNGGSIEEALLEKYKTPCPEALVESAINSIKILEDLDFFNTKISVKASDVMLCVKSYELLAKSCDYPLHIGITEAGTEKSGTIKSSVGLGYLLMQGIGDTIRVSLSTSPEREIPVAFGILKSIGLREYGVTIISCPSCARQKFDVCKVASEIEKRTEHIKKPIRISILGCVVNGIGEAKESDIGLTGAGSSNHLIYINGEPCEKIREGEDIVEKLMFHINDLEKI